MQQQTQNIHYIRRFKKSHKDEDEYYLKPNCDAYKHQNL